MATLNKLSLSGVRSFGPDSCDEQRIYFEKPFNLILGRNGCGKTTIIEALKYSCSGTMPAGQGANLVRDPKLDKQAETRAQIKMNFQSGRGEDCTITRSMSSKIKGGKALEFKTVDTVIQVINKNGKPEHLAGRCADMDDLMIKLLGVSKPILNYVIFCHQEDSHWPLDEGKKLKEKFDEIFDSTKYNKCMNEVRKLRKAAIDEKKVAEVSLKHLESDVETLKQKRGELLLLNESFSKMEENLQVFQKEILSYEEENIVWRRKYKDYEKSKSERDDAKNQLSKLMYEQETEKKHITHFFTGSEAELQIEIRSFDDQLQLKQEASTRILRRIEKLSDLESQKKTQSLDIQKLICKLEADKEQEQKIKMDRNLKLSHLARSFELSGLPADATEEDVDQLHHQVKRKFQTLVNSISAMKLQQEKEQNDLQEEINRCIQIKAKIESEIQVKEGNVSSNDAEILTLKGKLRSVNESLKKKQQIDRELEDSREKRVKASKNEDSEALAIKIDELQQLCSSLEKRQNELSTELVELLKYQGTQKSLQTQEEKHKDALTQIQRLRCKNEDSISKLLGNSTDGTLKQDFDRLLQKLKREIDQLKNLKSEKNGEISSLDLNRNHKKSSLEKKQANLQTKKESLFKLCGKKKLDEVLNAIETEMDSLQNDKGLFTSTQIVLSGYVKQLKGDPCCPLCRRNFTDDHDASVLADEITESMNNLPGRVEELNEKLSKLQQKQRSLLQLKPVEKEVMDLESEIPSLQNDVLGLEGVLDATGEELRDVEERLQSPEADLRTAEDIQNVIFDIDRYHKESKLCARQIDNLRRELSHLSSASRTSEQCAAEQQLISDELSAKRREKDGVEKRQRDYLNILNTFDQQINKLVSQQLEIKEFVQQEDAMKERLTELSHVNDTIQTEIKDLSQKLKPASEKKRNAEDALDTTKEKHKRKIQEIENMKQEREMSIRLLTETKETLNNFRSRKISESLQFNKEAHQKLINEINHLETEHDDLAKQSNDLQETLGEHSKRKKELEGNMTVLKLSKQIKKQEEVLEMAEKKLGDTDAKGVINKINDIEGKISDVKCQVNELKGNKRGLEDNIKSRKEELQEDRYRNAERKYKEKFVKLTVLSHTEKDLQKYYNALDTAMQHFHRDRMASVNKLIRELWRLIYRGNDTDFIEIKTDESALGSASNATDKKRNYNYRVVQVKNGTEIDMRGRCSAGQKVLASLIIRLALAETFSANCGILALDEPTTNLDKDNIRSLCHAIVEIVHEREQTSNFQLICITHDHEFLEMMTDMDFFSHYWEVSRDHRSKSVIKKRAVCKE